MKTTIDIPDALYRRAKIRAAERGVTMKSLLVDAFERAVSDPPSASVVEEGTAGYAVAAPVIPTLKRKPATKAGVANKSAERLREAKDPGFTVNESGVPVLDRKPGDRTVITNEMINRMRDEEGI